MTDEYSFYIAAKVASTSTVALLPPVLD